MHNKVMQQLLRKLKIGSIWKHYKGDFYKVNSIVIYEPTGENCVHYSKLYRNKNKPNNFVRPINIWFENVNVNGKNVPRFKKL